MAVHLRRDSDGVTHQVMAQQQASTCGVASIWMARCIAKRTSFNESEWALAWRTYHRAVAGMDRWPAVPAPMSLDPRAHGPDVDTFGDMASNGGLIASEMTLALKADGVHVVQVTPYDPVATVLDPGRIGEGRPAIIGVGWYDGGDFLGGHAVVAARRTQSGRIVYLDPAGGVLIEGGRGPRYEAPYSSSGRIDQIIYIAG